MKRADAYRRCEELPIGGIFPLSGYLSWIGKYKRMAADLKVEMINEGGGIDGRPVRLIAFDDRSSVQHAQAIAETLVFRHRVLAIVGTGSLPVSRAVASVANRYRTPAFVNSGYAIDPLKDLFVFNTAHRTEFTVARSFRYFLERGVNRMALMMPAGSLGDLGSLLARRLGRQMGMRIVGEERFDPGSADMASRLARLGALRPLALFSFVTGRPAAALVEEAAKAGLGIPLLVSHGNANPRFLKMVSHIPVEVIVPSGGTTVPAGLGHDHPCKGKVADFNRRHMDRYGEPANYYSAELADAIDLVAGGLGLAGEADPEKLRDAVEEIRNFEGMQGVYDLTPLDHYGTRIDDVAILTIKDGAWQMVGASCADGISDRGMRLVRKVADMLYARQPEALVPSPDAGAIAAFVYGATPGGADVKADACSGYRLYCEQKKQLTSAMRDRDAGKATEAFFRLLAVVLIGNAGEVRPSRLAMLEMFLAMLDTAIDEGADFEEMVFLKQRLIAEWEEIKDNEPLCLWALRVFDATSTALTTGRQRKNIDLLRKVTGFIEAHLSEDLTIKRIAGHVCLSPSRLIHRMRSELGVTVGSCVTRIRIEKAKQLLRSSDASISRVAQEVGYGDQSYFTRVFRKQAGCAPSGYRRMTSRLSPVPEVPPDFPVFPAPEDR